MKKTMIAVLSLLTVSAAAYASGISNKHRPLGLSQEPEQQQCLQCHGGFSKLAETTKNTVPNPHANHMGRVQCNACHTWTTAPKLMCNDCHNFPNLQKALEQ